ncbi:MAG: HD domain-containing protein [Desulfobacterales bacterium]
MNTSSIPPKMPDDQSASGIDPEDALIQVKAFAKACFDKASGSHDWEHTLRVFRLCEMIGRAENADMGLLRVAAYLHDIGRSLQDTSNGVVCHAEKGAQMAEPFVERLPLTKKQKQNIIHCIRSHRFRNHHTPGTAEAKVLFDADKLDAIGAIGVARAFLFAGEVGARLHNPELDVENAKPYSADDTGYREFKVKLCKIKDQMLTAEGRKLARERHAFMNDFFNRFLEEYEGKR